MRSMDPGLRRDDRRRHLFVVPHLAEDPCIGMDDLDLYGFFRGSVNWRLSLGFGFVNLFFVGFNLC